MVSRQSRWFGLFGALALLAGGACARQPAPFANQEKKPRSDRPAPYNPAKNYPEWAYDKPSYMKPEGEPKAELPSREKDPPHFFSSKTVVMVQQPEGYDPEEIARIGIWVTHDNGFHWKRVGYFGRSESFYPLQVKGDGDYGVRFVGPGQEAAMESLAYPNRVYHVDTKKPLVTISVDPEQAWYNIGQTVRVAWTAADPHLTAQPVRLFAITDWESDRVKPIEIAQNLADTGSMNFTIPNNLLGDGFRFRADAIDRAGNLGIAYSHTLQIVTDPVDGGERPPVRMSTYRDTSSAAPMPNDPTPPPAPAQWQTTPAPSQWPSTPPSNDGQLLPLQEVTPSKGASQNGWESSSSPAGNQAASATYHAPGQVIGSGSTTATGTTDRTDIGDASPTMTAGRSGSINAQPIGIHHGSTPNTTRVSTAGIGDGHTGGPQSPLAGPTRSVAHPAWNWMYWTAVSPRDGRVFGWGVGESTDTSNRSDGAIVHDSPTPSENDTGTDGSGSEEAVVRPVSASDDAPAGSTTAVESDASTDDDDESDEGMDGGASPDESPTDTTGASVSQVLPDANGHDSSLASVDGNVVAPLGMSNECNMNEPVLGQDLVDQIVSADLNGATQAAGGGLAAPMPATVWSIHDDAPAGPTHPWRSLTSAIRSKAEVVWSLPRPSLKFELTRLFARQTVPPSPQGARSTKAGAAGEPVRTASLVEETN